MQINPPLSVQTQKRSADKRKGEGWGKDYTNHLRPLQPMRHIRCVDFISKYLKRDRGGSGEE